jgi:hypothetical protein
MRTTPKLNKYVGLVLFVFMLAAAGVGKAEDPPTISACELFKNLAEWSGKAVAVHGEYFSTFEVTALGQRDCPEAPETEGIRWRTAIDLTGKPSGAGVAVTNESKSLNFYSELVRLLQSIYVPRSERMTNTLPVHISATLVGVLSTSKTYGQVARGYNEPPFLSGGFGHMGAYPAQLYVTAVRDIEITGLETAASKETALPK